MISIFDFAKNFGKKKQPAPSLPEDVVRRQDCDAIIITCMDFRFQKSIEDWQNEHFGDYSFDKISTAGACFDLNEMMEQVDKSVLLHKIKQVVIINHEDCGAYGDQGTYQRHCEDLAKAATKIKHKHHHLQVKTYFLHTDGFFEEITTGE